MANQDANVLQLSAESSYEHMEDFASLTEEAARRMGLSEDDESDLMISVMEAINNAIQHGNSEDASKQVKLRIEIAPGQVTILVQDEGNGFKPDLIPDPTEPDNLLNVSGRGILMMKAFMDEVNFSPSETGLVVMMIKKYSPEQS